MMYSLEQLLGILVVGALMGIFLLLAVAMLEDLVNDTE